MTSDEVKLEETRELLEHATDSDEIVRLRARADALQRRVEEAGLLGRAGAKIEKLGAKMQHFDAAKHRRNRVGEWAKTGHKLGAERHPLAGFGKNESGTHEEMLHHFFSGNDPSILGHEHVAVTKSLRAVGHGKLADELDRVQKNSMSTSYAMPKDLHKRVKDATVVPH